MTANELIRKMKFRAKQINDNNWIYGYGVVIGDGFCAIPCCIRGDARDWKLFTVTCDINTLGQYTGLKDKNGKEIYEGDILRVEEFKNESDSIEKSEEFYEVFDLEDMKGEKIREYITPVCWEYGAFAISVSQENDTYLDVLFGDMRRSFPIFIFEIIGNIHDNPEHAYLGEKA